MEADGVVRDVSGLHGDVFVDVGDFACVECTARSNTEDGFTEVDGVEFDAHTGLSEPHPCGEPEDEDIEKSKDDGEEYGNVAVNEDHPCDDGGPNNGEDRNAHEGG